jgi:hypothetical protein
MSPISDETTQTFDDTAVYPLTENAYERLKKEETRDLGLTVIRFENEDIVCTIEEAKELHLYQPDAKVRIQYGEWHNLSIAGLVRLQNANPEDPSITRELKIRLNKEGLEYCAHNLAFYGSSNKGYIAFSNPLLNRPITCKEYSKLNQEQRTEISI